MKFQLRKSPWWCYILIFVISQLSAVLIPVVAHLTGHAISPGSEAVLVGGLFLANILAILLFLIFRPGSITWHSTIAGVVGRKGRRTLISFLMALPLMLLLNLTQEVFFPEIPDLVGEDTFLLIMGNPIGLLTVAVLGPVSEEMLFRGGVQTDISRHYSHLGWQVPILFSAVLFSIVHMNPAQMPAALLLGLLLGFAYWWTGSLAAPIFIHVFNNSFACLLSVLSPVDDSLVHFLGGNTSAGICAVLCVFGLYLTLLAVKKEGVKPL
ncbi:MAG: CPBP family intramembrane metalloprotease [Bacteroidaceae bacterium]|nr:CPBP family intramembrane metalloprotease [Bacteroidaceae bacterium]